MRNLLVSGEIAMALVLLVGSAVLNLVKGFDLEEAVAALAVAGYLVAKRRAFSVSFDRPSLRRGLVALASGRVLATVVSNDIVVPLVTGPAFVHVTTLPAALHDHPVPLPET